MWEFLFGDCVLYYFVHMFGINQKFMFFSCAFSGVVKHMKLALSHRLLKFSVNLMKEFYFGSQMIVMEILQDHICL